MVYYTVYNTVYYTLSLSYYYQDSQKQTIKSKNVLYYRKKEELIGITH